MRGLAAVCVVLGHLTLALPAVDGASRVNGFTFWNVALYSPLHMVFAQHVLLVSHCRDDAQYVPVIWSLSDERRISLAFPLLIAAVAAFGWWRCVVASVVLTAVGVPMRTIVLLAIVHRFDDVALG
ncbi:hypothetical protein DSM104299_04744 [Baekduia alba]|nr:hypothetical protein DSM104299_04744 [Baekduia alba]